MKTIVVRKSRGHCVRAGSTPASATTKPPYEGVFNFKVFIVIKPNDVGVMKFNIKNSREARAFNIIYDYIDDLIGGEHRVEYSDPDEDGDLYHGDRRSRNTTTISVYQNDGEYNLIFRIYLPNYWNKGVDLIEQSPIISFYKPYVKELNRMFVSLWHDPFRIWFKHNFPELSDIHIKTFDKHF